MQSCASCVCVCVCARLCERGRHGHTTPACVLKIHISIIMSFARLCSPLGLELMVNLRTLTVFTFILKADTHDNGKRCYISDSCLWCSANHNALSAGQSEQTALVGCLKEAGHRGPTIMYSNRKIGFLNIKVRQHILLYQIHKTVILCIIWPL